MNSLKILILKTEAYTVDYKLNTNIQTKQEIPLDGGVTIFFTGTGLASGSCSGICSGLTLGSALGVGTGFASGSALGLGLGSASGLALGATTLESAGTWGLGSSLNG